MQFRAKLSWTLSQGALTGDTKLQKEIIIIIFGFLACLKSQKLELGVVLACNRKWKEGKGIFL